MIKNLLSLVIGLFFINNYAQVGIGTNNPKSTLHVSENDSSPIKGIIIPNITFNVASTMTISAEQNSMIVYIKDIIGDNKVPRMKNVYYPGFYYLDNLIWEPLNSPVFITNNNPISSNNDYDTGIRLVKHVKNSTYSGYYAPLGRSSVDFSYAYTGNLAGYGAKGDYSFATGIQNLASGNRSAVFGGLNESSGNNSMSWNGSSSSLSSNKAKGNSSTAWGWRTTSEGNISTAFGYSTVANAPLEVVFGYDNTSYTALDVTTNNTLNGMIVPKNTDRLLTIGNGTPSIKADALTLLRNGKLGVGISNFETTTSDAIVQVNGSIKVASENPTLASSVCNASNLGKIIFVEDSFYGCKSVGWKKLDN
ncbi:hypothetical protein [Empedobacter sedimenti]|uniref:hypothetical protein n=1 Tax=Empedobacter sedimenti TaxID=3042610 RepID=UPI0024A68A76|nr:hypothetical protein [Empedobacter sedimenti]